MCYGVMICRKVIEQTSVVIQGEWSEATRARVGMTC